MLLLQLHLPLRHLPPERLPHILGEKDRAEMRMRVVKVLAFSGLACFSSKCSPFVLWLHALHFCVLDCPGIHSLIWPAFSFSYSGGGRIETGKRGPGRPKKQTEHVDKSTGSHDKDRGEDKERALDEKGSGKRAAQDDSGDAHLSGYKKKQSLVACSSFVYA